jgi:phage I-like protein
VVAANGFASGRFVIARGPWQPFSGMSATVNCSDCGAPVGTCDCTSQLGGSPPNEILLFPCPTWELADMNLVTDELSQRTVIGDFQRRQIEIVIDYEHSSEEEGADPAPAAGWIPKLRADSTGLYGSNVRWTSDAAALITAGKYRYWSPVALYDENDRVVALISVALTNKPRTNKQIPMTARRIAASIADNYGKKENGMKKALTLLLAFLGQKGSITRKAAIEQLKAVSDAIEAEDGEETAPLVTAKADKVKTIASLAGIETEGDGDGKAEELLGEVFDLLDLPADASKKKVRATILALQHPADVVSKAEFEKVVAERDKALAGGKAKSFETLIAANRNKVTPALEKKLRERITAGKLSVEEASELIADMGDVKPVRRTVDDEPEIETDGEENDIVMVGDDEFREVEPESAKIAASVNKIIREHKGDKPLSYAEANEIRKNRERAQ